MKVTATKFFFRTLPVLSGLLTIFFVQPSKAQNPGGLDTSFHTGSGANNIVYTSCLQTDGKIVIAGKFTNYGGATANYIARLNTNGSLDPSFAPVGTGVSSTVLGSAIQADGKIIIVGNFYNYNQIASPGIARLNTDGSLDTTFHVGSGVDYIVETISVQTDGKIVIGGAFTIYNGSPANKIVRLNTNGTLDPTFNAGGGADNTVYTSVLQTDGKIIISGLFISYNGTSVNGLARLNTNGSLDNTYNVGSGLDHNATTLAMQVDGKCVLGGIFTVYNGDSVNRILRLNTDGSRDTSFHVGKGLDGNAPSIAIQQDGKIVIGGVFTQYNGKASSCIARLNTDGSYDNIFYVGSGANGSLHNAMAIQTDGKIIIGGAFTAYNGTVANRVARLNGGTCTLPTVVAHASRTYVCSGNLVTLTGTGASTYSWTNGVTNGVAFPAPAVTTTYTVVGTGVNGCVNTATELVSVLSPVTPQICMVTVDSLSINNIIVWDKTSFTGVDSFFVYRYDVASSNYLRIGAVPYGALSQWIDTARNIGGPNGGDPQYSSYRYELATHDTCGHTSPLGAFHQSMFIQQNNQNFTWTAYIAGNGPAVTGYQFLRRDNPTSAYHVLINTQNLSATDPNYALYPSGSWRVEVLNFNCNATAKSYNTSRSNSARAAAAGINELTKNRLFINVYPNPAENLLHLNGLMGKTLIKLFDIMGKEIVVEMKSISGNGGEVTMDVSRISPGIYTLVTENDNSISFNKVVIARY
jgi:uncharacterized delta-60 repeat protein